ncbi:unnamed protein product [Staurois parvus]|uniref:Uncharacterized protein n=1 Tax=Staurois parvus TaxID=386267 RepID=A0ABN9FNA2_9NEOB|nr:unnamed protein product [Staurois parvus]
MRFVLLHDLPLRGWVAVVPSCFHFVIIPLTAERGIFSSKDIFTDGLFAQLAKYQGIKVPRLNSLSS